MTVPVAIAASFDLPSPPVATRPFHGGHINKAWLVTTASGGLHLLQRLNTEVFKDPAAVMANALAVTMHLKRRNVRTLRFRPTLEGEFIHEEPSGTFWRVCDFIPDTVGLTVPRTAADCRAAGLAFGQFASHLAAYPAAELLDTIPGFHATGLRLAALFAAQFMDSSDRLAECREEVSRLRDLGWLARALPVDELPVRVAHNDAKLANILLDKNTSQPVCVVDLDTVMPGTLLHDFGDLVRSLVTPEPEDSTRLDRVMVQERYFENLVAGYLEGAGGLLTDLERSNLVTAGLVITYEQAIRFLADHLAGDVYYKVSRPGHNLDRARNQLRLLEQLLGCVARLEDLVSAASS